MSAYGSMRASVNGTELFYEISGQGPAILFMHGGMGLDHTYFRPWLDALADAYRLVFYDHRGNGRSAEPEDWSDVNIETLVRDAEALREHLELERIFLFGHSFGGFLALEYALRYPDRLAGLILCCTAPAFDYADVALLNARLRATDEQMEALARALSTRAPDDSTVSDWWRQIFPLYFHDPEPALLDRVAGRIRYRAGAWNRTVFELMPSFDVTSRIRSVVAPTLVIGGADDWIMPSPEAAERLDREMPRSDLLVLERCGHFPWVEQHDGLVNAVRDWLHRSARSSQNRR